MEIFSFFKSKKRERLATLVNLYTLKQKFDLKYKKKALANSVLSRMVVNWFAGHLWLTYNISAQDESIKVPCSQQKKRRRKKNQSNPAYRPVCASKNLG